MIDNVPNILGIDVTAGGADRDMGGGVNGATGSPPGSIGYAIRWLYHSPGPSFLDTTQGVDQIHPFR